MDIRDNLREYIDDKAIKQAVIAPRVGLTASQLCAVLKKRRSLDANELFLLCDALGVLPDDLRAYKPTGNGLSA